MKVWVPEGSELYMFASWFNQDYDLFFSDFREGRRLYLERLAGARAAGLRAELDDFLARWGTASSTQVMEVWLDVGAEAWDPDLDLILFLRETRDLLALSEGG